MYDIIIIGGGPGGYQAAMDASASGFSTALIESEKLGGTCLNEGCLPTKSLLYSAKIFHKIQEEKLHGIHADNVSIQLEQVIDRKNNMVFQAGKGMDYKLKQSLTDVFYRTGHIKSAGKEIQVDMENGDCIRGKHLIIASGSRPFFPEIDGLQTAFQEGFAIDSRRFLDQTGIYKKTVIVGGGFIGIEFASFLSDIGVAVIVLDSRKNILEELDEDVRKVFVRSLMKKGITFRLGIQIVEIDSRKKRVSIKGETEEEILCDQVLMCTGRVPNIYGMGMEESGIAVKDDKIVTDDYCRTNVERVYAIGDVNGKVMLAHTAYAEARSVIWHIMGSKQKVEYHRIPRVIYSCPEAAWVGASEQNLRKENMEYGCGSCSMRYSGKFMVENIKEQGICKLIWDKKSRQIQGCFLIGDGASEIIITVKNMIEEHKTLDDIKQMVFPHPSIGEIIQECVYMAEQDEKF